MNPNRRDFIKLTGLAASATLLSSLESIGSTPMPAIKTNENYKLKVLATNWGFEGTMDAFCAKAKKEGYDGIENWWPDDIKEQDEMFVALKKHNLEVGFLYGAWQANPAEHLAHFKKVMDVIAKQKAQQPLYINLHSGRDYFSFDDNKKFIEYTNALAKDTGILICHETHRGRMLYAAHVTKDFIHQYPELKLTLDISHWCNVHESLLDDQPETVELALQRTEHIHARIGYAEGPQVNDPRAPEWDGTVKQHFAWWDKVVKRKKKNGETMTFLTEFGPPLYMPTLPYTLQPVSDQWAINVHMLQLLRKRYS
ncbi:MAG: sugar phosphate isomerase/epimerase [Chitinophagales bacterium]|nr:sugar phosphate isomerase/epimerase [Chitinophagales bacterium]